MVLTSNEALHIPRRTVPNVYRRSYADETTQLLMRNMYDNKEQRNNTKNALNQANCSDGSLTTRAYIQKHYQTLNLRL